MYDWVTLLYSRNWYNIVNQLYFKYKKKENSRKSDDIFIHFCLSASQWIGVQFVGREASLLVPSGEPGTVIL